jgi:VWFA-related protein
MRHRVLFVLVAAVPTAVLLTLHAQQPQAPSRSVFRGGTDLIPVDVSVLDANRRPVRGLTAADFTVLEDGKPRPVVAFSEVEVPGPERGEATTMAPWIRDAPHDVISNDLPVEGRVVVILMDGTIPDGQPTLTAKQIARAAVDELGPGDLAAVVRSTVFVGNNGLSQGFTADRSRLIETIESPFMGTTEPPDMSGGGLQSPSPVPNSFFQTRDQCEVIRDIARAMRDAPRRRKMLLFVGSSIQMGGRLRETTDIRSCRDAMFREVDMANVTVQSIDPVGLNTTSPSADYITHGRISPNLVPGWNQDNLRRLDNLRVLPDHTGGRLVANANDPATLMPAIFAESQAYYLLGFEPSVPSSNGKFHSIRVQVKRRGATVRARTGYLATAPARPGTPGPALPAAVADAPAPELAAALEGALPRQDLPLSVTVAPFALPAGKNAAVAVAVGATLPAGAGSRLVDLTIGAFDIRGRAVAVRSQTFEMPGTGAKAGSVDDGLVARLDLPPGRYELRAAAKDTASGAIGSVFSFIDVPDFSRGPLTTSGLLLHHAQAPRVADNPLAAVIPIVPTVARLLAPADKVNAYLRIYQHDMPQAVAVTVRVIDTGNRTSFEQRMDLAAGAFVNRAADVDVALPLSQLAGGRYLLSVDVARGESHVERLARLEVRTAP